MTTRKHESVCDSRRLRFELSQLEVDYTNGLDGPGVLVNCVGDGYLLRGEYSTSDARLIAAALLNCADRAEAEAVLAGTNLASPTV